MKKALIVFCVVCMTAFMSAIMFGCKKIHKHVYSEWKVEEQASCESPEKQYRICECGEKEIREVGESLGHNLSLWVTISENTCTTSEILERSCDRCEYREEKEGLAATGHIESEWIVDEDSSCTETGMKHKECLVCEITTQSQTINKKEHDITEWKEFSPATCIEAQILERHCRTCSTQNETKEGLSALGHTESGWIVDEDSSCTETGMKHKECLVCETTTQSQTIDKKEHDLTEWKEFSPATCIEAQILERHCRTCSTQSETKTGESALGHSESEWVDCLDQNMNETGYQEKVCLRCTNRIDYSPKTYTITFESNGGSIVESITGEFDEMIMIPINPTKEGYLFKGWYLDNNTFNNEFFTLFAGFCGKMPIGGAVLYAKWEEIIDTFVDRDTTYRYLGDNEYEIVKGDLNQYTLPSMYGNNYNVVSIADDAFNSWTDFSVYDIDFVLPKSVKTIGKNAFKNARLRSIYFETGSQLQSIGDNAFSDNNLINETLKLPEGLKTIGNNAFSTVDSNENYIYTVYLPSTLEDLGSNVFDGQARLNKVIYTGEKIKNNANYINLKASITTLDVSSGEFTWVEDILFFKADSESFARLVCYNPSGTYTQTISDGIVLGDYEVITLPRFEYDYVIESFTFYRLQKIFCILFEIDANIIEIQSYAFGSYQECDGNPFTLGDILNQNTTNYPNFLFSSDMDWDNIVLYENWLHVSNQTFCCVQIYGSSETKTDKLLDRLNDTLTIDKSENSFCVNIDSTIYDTTSRPNSENYKFRGLFFGGSSLTKYL